MKKISCLALLALLFLAANSCHDEVATGTSPELKSADVKKKEIIESVKSWFESNPDANTFELLKWKDEIKWPGAKVMEISNSVVVEVQVKLKGNLRITGDKDPSLNVDQRLLFIKENGVIRPYMEYFVSKQDLSNLQDVEKVNYSKRGKDFDGKIVLESPKKEVKVISGLNATDECGELRLKNATTICMCLVECFSDGTIRIICVLWCWDPADGDKTANSGTTPPPTTTTPCNCVETCPVCGKCKTLLKSAPVDNADGSTNPTTGSSNCELCAGHPVPVVDASGLQVNAKAWCIYNKLNNGSFFTQAMNRFNAPSQPEDAFLGELNLSWRLGGSQRYYGYTVPLGVSNNNSLYSVEIYLNETQLNANSLTLTALTMLHEAMHAKLTAEFYTKYQTTEFNDLLAYYSFNKAFKDIDTGQEKAMFDNYADKIAQALYEFDQRNGISNSYVTYLNAVKYDLGRQLGGTYSFPSGIDAYNKLKYSTITCN